MAFVFPLLAREIGQIPIHVMKISLFIRSLVTGGSQRQLIALATGLARRSHDITVIVLYSSGNLETELGGTGVRLLSLGKSSRWDVGRPLIRLWRYLRTEQPDLLYAFQPVQSVIAALMLPPWRATRLVFGIRAGQMEFDRYDALLALSYRLEARLSCRADLIVVNGHAIRDDAIARGFAASKVVVIPNGIDTDLMRPDRSQGRRFRQSLGIDEGTFVIGMVARLDPMKDHMTFLAAAALFSKIHADARFVCVGDGPAAYRSELSSSAESIGLGSRIIWAGESQEVSAAYNAFDIVTLTSSFGEGFPNVIGEAMACARPVVATDVGETARVLGDHGELVPPRRPDLVAQAWSRMRQRILAEGETLGTTARAHVVDNFSVEAMVERSEKVFANLCAGMK
jgi:glycosyltransferase involved in cell wall biosynthesis